MSEEQLKNRLLQLRHDELTALARKLGVRKYTKKARDALVDLILSEKSGQEIEQVLLPPRPHRFRRILAWLTPPLIGAVIAFVLWDNPRPRTLTQSDVDRIAKTNKEYLDKEYRAGHTTFGVQIGRDKGTGGVIVPKGDTPKGFDLGFESARVIGVNANSVDILFPKIEVSTANVKGFRMTNTHLRMPKAVGSRVQLFRFGDVVLYFEVLSVHKDVVYVAAGLVPAKS